MLFVLPIRANKNHLEKERVSNMGLFRNDRSTPLEGGTGSCQPQASVPSAGHPASPLSLESRGEPFPLPRPWSVTAWAPPVSSPPGGRAAAALSTVCTSPRPGQQDVRILSHFLSSSLQGARLVEADGSALWCVGCFLPY